MTTQTIDTVANATVPRVNLLPPEIAEAAQFRRVQLAMGGAVVLAAVLIGGLYVHSKSGVTDAQQQVDAAQSQQASLQGKLATLQTVKATYADVQSKQVLLQQAMGNEIRWSFTLNDLAIRIPSHVWLTSITAAETAPGASATSTTTPPATTTLSGAGSTAVAGPLGTITFNGVAFNHDDVAGWLDALGGEKGFANPSFSSSTEAMIGTRPVDDFVTAVNLTSAELSNRYTEKTGN